MAQLNRIVSLRNVIILIALIALFVIGNKYLFDKVADLPPNMLMEKAVETTINQEGYRFNVQAKAIIAGQEDLLMEVTGVKGGKEKNYMKGTIQGSDIEVYQVGTTIYSRDIVSRKLIVTQNKDMNEKELLLSDLNPMANFNFKEIPEAKKLMEEEVDGIKCIVIESRPNVDNPFLELLWKDFTYKIWVDKKKQFIRKAILKAESKSVQGDEYLFTLHIFDYDKKINFQVPKE